MVTVIVPVSGAINPRDGKPMWLRTGPRGELVVQLILSRLNLSAVSRVLIVTLQEHIDAFLDGNVGPLEATLSTAVGTPVSICTLDEPTDSAPETVAACVARHNVDGPIFVKDGDGSFDLDVVAGNYVVGVRLGGGVHVEQLSMKSFLERSGVQLTNIVEKEIVSDTIAVGGYAFESTAAFLEALREVLVLRQRSAVWEQDSSSLTVSVDGQALLPRVYMSNVVRHMLLRDDPQLFLVKMVSDFADLKTEAGWRYYLGLHRNYLVQLEGVLFNPAPSSERKQTVPQVLDFTERYSPLPHSIAYLRQLRKSHRGPIVVMTHLPESERSALEALLRQHDVPHDGVVFGLCEAPTVVIASYGDGVNHPGCVAYSMPRGADELGGMLHLS